MSNTELSPFVDNDRITFADPFAAAATRSVEHDRRGHKCEVKLYDSRLNSRGDRVFLQTGEDSRKRAEMGPSRKFDEHAAMLKVQEFDESSKVVKTMLHIQSPYIETAMREVIKHYPGLNLASSPIIIQGKPKCFFHYRNELVEYAMTLQDSIAIEHLQFAMDYMYSELQTETAAWFLWAEPLPDDVLASLDLRRDHDLPGIDFDNLWMAFRPGCLVYERERGSDIVMRLEETEDTSSGSLKLKLTQVVHNGDAFGRRLVNETITSYVGYKAFIDLPLCPLQYQKDHLNIYTQAVARGKQIIPLFSYHFRQYNGKALLMSKIRQWDYDQYYDEVVRRRTSVCGRIILDSASFGEANSSVTYKLTKEHKTYATLHGARSAFGDDDYAVYYPTIAGFSLRDKQWGFFDVSHITDVKFSEDAFLNLILPGDQKEMLLALVRSHYAHSTGFDDFIQGKGRGMIFLLHGPAGVGKTLTAESVAEKLRRPLYVVGAGDLGIDVHSVERKLSEILKLAIAWNALVLIDEADIFLEERSVDNLKRNAIVSAFLRTLEYFEGIMFLTTNRVKHVDRAFSSRIHMAIHYNNLDAAARRELWQTFVIKANFGFRPQWLTEPQLDELASIQLNGRQIKHVVRVAYGFSASDSRQIERRHITISLENMQMFDRIVNGDDDVTTEDEEDSRQARNRKRPRGM